MKSLMIGLFVSLFSLQACSGDSQQRADKDLVEDTKASDMDNAQKSEDSHFPDSVADALTQENSALSQELRNSLSYMGNEERLAYDIYNAFYEKYGTRQFTNIANNSEIRHIQAVQELVVKYGLNDKSSFSNVDMPPLGNHDKAVEDMPAGTYDISKIQKLYDDLFEMGSKSEVDALKVGCIVEVVDINDLDEFIELAVESEAPDVESVFHFLRNGSYNHYWASDRGLKQRGIEDGCCALGTIDGTDYCHPEYPQN